MVVCVASYFTNWFSVREIASQVMTDSWDVIDGHKQLWSFFVSSEKLEWNRLIEQVVTIFNCSVGVESDICSCKRLVFTAHKFKLSWVYVLSLKSNENGTSISPRVIFTHTVDFGCIKHSVTSSMHILINPVNAP